jgi:succinate dehydrogenase / fumarate reductase cytochrome b subunit
MNKLSNFYSSSVGKKFIVGFTGLFLCSFLVVHLMGNLLLFRPDEGMAFDKYADFMASNPIIRTLEIILFVGFFIHIFIATLLWFRNRLARPQTYAVNRPEGYSSFSSRMAFVTGSCVFIFLMVHLNSFWITSRFHAEEYPSMYELVHSKFSSATYCGFYVLAMILLGYHLKHGFQSAFQTFGLREKKYTPLIEAVGAIFWLLIPIGFASMPIFFLFWRS